VDQKAAFSNREQLYTYYDDYAAKRRKNIDKHRLDAGKNLLKSYVLGNCSGGLFAGRLAAWR
jgi:hypothetical protein